MSKESTADYYEMTLAEIREHKGFTRRDLSRATGISEGALYLIEAKGQIPKADTIALICRVLDITPKTLLHSLGIDVTGIPDT